MSERVTSHERVLTACAFQRPDRIPRYDQFWEFPESWRAELGPEGNFTDVAIWVPNEGTFPTRTRTLREENGWVYEIDMWGRTIRRRQDAYFCETLDTPLQEGVDIDGVQFDPATLEDRYLQGLSSGEALDAALIEAKRRYCVFGKTGGPYLRTTYVRGETQFLLDIAQDPDLAKALADKMADHLVGLGLYQLHRWSLYETGIWIFDDLAYNTNPMFSPESFERIFLPAYRRMIAAYKQAGARYVFLHSDGNIWPLLDMLIDAGIDGLNPLERRAGMHPALLRARYPRLILAGGMCNSDTLINGPLEKVEAEARELIDIGRDGGVIIGTHSLSPEVRLEYLAAYDHVCKTYGDFTHAR